jgi:hypothetical protein
MKESFLKVINHLMTKLIELHGERVWVETEMG